MDRSSGTYLFVDEFHGPSSDTDLFVDEFHGPDGVGGSDRLSSVLHCDVIVSDTAVLRPVPVTFALYTNTRNFVC